MGRFSFRKKGAKDSPKRVNQPEASVGLVENNQISDNSDSQHDFATSPKQFAFLKDKIEIGNPSGSDKSPEPSVSNLQTACPFGDMAAEHEAPKKPTITPGSQSEHELQQKWGSRDRALNFYDRQVLDYLAPKMKEFIARQEFLFVASADRNGECDCTSKFGKPGFIRVLGDKFLIYPEYRGNGVFANSGNMTENPHIAMLMIDFTRDTVGMHVNGKVRIVANEELLQYAYKLPKDIIEEIHQEGKKCPERWVMIEVEEAYIQCSKHIPLMKKLDKKIDWGTDNMAAKGGDYFQLLDIPLFDRVGGDRAMEVAVDLFYRKVLQDDLVGHFFEDTDMESQRLKQKSFLSMAFGGPYHYTDQDLRAAHKPLLEKYGLSDEHFDRILELFNETLAELNISANELQGIMEILESTRETILNR
jgi:truncated hemoglobin YjbI/predicted pyridoxine 5'-phosphate oxidase superfamily flavin-nucleotide-binding protein